MFVKPAAGEGDEEASTPAAIGFIADIQQANKKLYQWAGIDLGQYNVLLLQKSLKELAVKTDASNLRLWGKIRGSCKDYYIVEGVSNFGVTD